MEGALQRGLARTHNRSHVRRHAVALSALACLVALTRDGSGRRLGDDRAGGSRVALAGVHHLQRRLSAAERHLREPLRGAAGGHDHLVDDQLVGRRRALLIKILRRTPDPDVFQVVAHSSSVLLTAGINTVPVKLPVRSGDMLGLNETGPPNSCTLPSPGQRAQPWRRPLGWLQRHLHCRQRRPPEPLRRPGPRQRFTWAGSSATARVARRRSP